LTAAQDRVRWADALRAIAQSGLTYAESPFDHERYEAVRRVAAELAASVTSEDAGELEALFAAEVGYATPKVDVRAVVLDEAGRVLLVNELLRSGWNLPGGWADVGSTPTESVTKEVREEAGLTVTAVRLLGVYSRDFRRSPRWPAHAYSLYVHCERVAGEPRGDGRETADAAFFPPDRLPPLTAKTGEARILRALELIARPDLAPDLD
jgi:ADP-ribose pyrophosphatase YjhB (NUDIX family)